MTAPPDEPTPEQLAALEDLRQEGKLYLIRVSNVTLAGVERALEHVELGKCRTPTTSSTACDERARRALPEHDIAFVPFFPLGSAFTGRPQMLAGDPAVAAVAEKHGATPSQVALAWLLARYHRILLIPGTTSVAPPRGEPRGGRPGARRRTTSRRWRPCPSRPGPVRWSAGLLATFHPNRRAADHRQAASSTT